MNPLTIALIAGWGLAAVSTGVGIVAYNIEAKHYADEKAAFADFKSDVAKKALDAQVKATELSNASIAKVSAALDKTAQTQIVYRDRIIAGPQSTCPPSPAAMDATAGVRATILRSP